MSGPVFHLDYERLEALVDGRADAIDQEIAEAHLEVCPSCRRLKDELVALREQIAARPALVQPPASAKRPARWLWPWTPLLAGGVAMAGFVVWTADRRPAPSPSPRMVAQVPTTTPIPTARPTPAPSAQPHRRPTPTPLIATALARSVQVAIASGRLALADLSSLQTPSVRVRGAENASTVRIDGLAPAATRVRQRRPTFTWRPVSGAHRYQIMVADDEDRIVTEAQGLSATQWRPADPLPRDRTLLWEIYAFNASGKEIARAPNVRFAVLSAVQAAAFERETERLASPSLEFAVVCARYGLREDARQTLERLRARTPSATVSRLLAGLR